MTAGDFFQGGAGSALAIHWLKLNQSTWNDSEPVVTPMHPMKVTPVVIPITEDLVQPECKVTDAPYPAKAVSFLHDNVAAKDIFRQRHHLATQFMSNLAPEFDLKRMEILNEDNESSFEFLNITGVIDDWVLNPDLEWFYVTKNESLKSSVKYCNRIKDYANVSC